MNPPSNSNLVTNASSQTLSEYMCPDSVFTWVLSDTTMFKVTATVTSIACPATFLLNILTIIAVKQRREMQSHTTNILLASMGIADALVGAVSMPLTITLDVLVLLKDVSANGFCRILFANVVMSFTVHYLSLLHLTLIAWERYVAIRRCMDFKVIVTRRRTVILSAIAWMLVVVIQIPPRIMARLGVEDKCIRFVWICSFLLAGFCIILTGYFYVKAYLFARKRRVEEIDQICALIKAKLERKIAKTTAILTAALLIFFLPSLIRLSFGNVFPALHRTSYFRWAQMLVQLRSLFNPVFHCYRDRRFRNACLEMLKMRKPNVKKPNADFLEVNIRRVDAVALSGNLREPQDGERQARITRSRSCESIIVLGDNNNWAWVHRERRMSLPPPEANKTIVTLNLHQTDPIRTNPRTLFEGSVITTASRNDESQCSTHGVRCLRRSISWDEGIDRHFPEKLEQKQSASFESRSSEVYFEGNRIVFTADVHQVNQVGRKEGIKPESGVLTNEGSDNHYVSDARISLSCRGHQGLYQVNSTVNPNALMRRRMSAPS